MNEKRAWLVFWAAWILLLPLRLWQQLFLVDRETGFYTDGGTVSYLLTGMLVLSVVLLFWFCRKEPALPEEEAPRLRSLGAGAAGMLTGFLFIGQGFYSLAGYPSMENQAVSNVLAIAGCAAGAVFLFMAYGLAVGENAFAKHPLLGLLPSLWGCVCLISMFVTYTAAVNGVENFYDTCTVIFFLLFLFSLAKYMAGLEGPKNLYRYGLPAVLLASVTGAAAFLLTMLGKELSSAFSAGLHLLNLGLALFVLSILGAVHADRKRKEKFSRPETDSGEWQEAERVEGFPRE